MTIHEKTEDVIQSVVCFSLFLDILLIAIYLSIYSSSDAAAQLIVGSILGGWLVSFPVIPYFADGKFRPRSEPIAIITDISASLMDLTIYIILFTLPLFGYSVPVIPLALAILFKNPITLLIHNTAHIYERPPSYGIE